MDSNAKLIPASLEAFVTDSIKRSVEEVIPDDKCAVSFCVDKLISALVREAINSSSRGNACEPDNGDGTAGLTVHETESSSSAAIRKRFAEWGVIISKLARAEPTRLQGLCRSDDESLVDIKEWIESYSRHSTASKRVFDQIQSLHQEIQEKGWFVATDEAPILLESRVRYAEAAKDMGEREWVQRGLSWMSTQILDYFCRGKRRQIVYR